MIYHFLGLFDLSKVTQLRKGSLTIVTDVSERMKTIWKTSLKQLRPRAERTATGLMRFTLTYGRTTMRTIVTAFVLLFGTSIISPVHAQKPKVQPAVGIVQPELAKLYPVQLQSAPVVTFEATKSHDAEHTEAVARAAAAAAAQAQAAADQANQARYERAQLVRQQVNRTELAPAPTGSRTLAQLRALYQAAGARYGIDPAILEAVHQVETGKSTDTARRSGAGATGPMQFLPSTWQKYAVDGNGDGVASITSVDDAVYGAANLLAAAGGQTNIDRALFAYNHSSAYVQQVKTVANSVPR